MDVNRLECEGYGKSRASTATGDNRVLLQMDDSSKTPFLWEMSENPLSPAFGKRPSALDARKDLLRRGYGKGEDDLRQPILVFGVGVFDVGLCFLKLGLGELDDRAET